MTERLSFLGTTFSLSTSSELLTAIEEATPGKPVRAATPNPEFLVLARHDTDFARSLGEMTHCLVDGYGLFLALQLYKVRYHRKLRLEHQPGSNFLERILDQYKDGTKRIYLLGGNPGSAERTRDQAILRYPNIAIVGAERGEELTTSNIVIGANQQERISAANPDILILGFGAPKQELWMQAAKDIFKIPTMIGLGGSFNFYNDKKRAPRPFQSLHLEWLWRGATEAGHLKRIWTAVLVFPILTLLSFRKRTP